MGFVKKVFSRPKPKPQPVVEQTAPADTSSNTSAEQEAKKKTQAAILANAGSRKSTVGGGASDVTQKVLLGL